MIIVERLINLYRYKNLLSQLVQRNLKLKYRRSVLGYLWSILDPLMMMLVMTIVFSTMFRRNIENFPVYLITGQVLFNFMSNSTRQAMTSIIGDGALLKKAYVPKYIFALARVTSSLMDFLFSLVALVLVMLITRVSPSVHLLFAPVIILQSYLFSLGLGLFLAQAAVFFRDMQYIYNVIIVAWTYLTPIFYPIEMLPFAVMKLVKWLNPMYCYIAQFRDVLLYHRMPSPHYVLYGIVLALAFLLFGAWSFQRSQDKFILYI